MSGSEGKWSASKVEKPREVEKWTTRRTRGEEEDEGGLPSGEEEGAEVENMCLTTFSIS